MSDEAVAGKNKKKHGSRHHVIPSSRGGSSDPFNIVHIGKKIHQIYHWLFSNLLPEEIVSFLNEKFWGGKYSIFICKNGINPIVMPELSQLEDDVVGVISQGIKTGLGEDKIYSIFAKATVFLATQVRIRSRIKTFGEKDRTRIYKVVSELRFTIKNLSKRKFSKEEISDALMLIISEIQEEEIPKGG